MIDRFEKEYRFLSNYYPAQLTYQGITYLNSEAAYQAQKCFNSDDRYRFKDLLPNEAKKLGQKIFLRSDWDEVKDSFMEEIIFAKFNQNPDLAKRLLDTNDEELIEGNSWGDRYWGVCDGVGENHLGKILMKVRNLIRESHQH